MTSLPLPLLLFSHLALSWTLSRLSLAHLQRLLTHTHTHAHKGLEEWSEGGAGGAVGSIIADLLAASSVWQQTKGQRHDLFLATTAAPALMLAPPPPHPGNMPLQRSTL